MPCQAGLRWLALVLLRCNPSQVCTALVLQPSTRVRRHSSPKLLLIICRHRRRGAHHYGNHTAAGWGGGGGLQVRPAAVACVAGCSIIADHVMHREMVAYKSGQLPLRLWPA